MIRNFSIKTLQSGKYLHHYELTSVKLWGANTLRARKGMFCAEYINIKYLVTIKVESQILKSE